MKQRARNFVSSGLMLIALAAGGTAIAAACHSVTICGPGGNNCQAATLCCYPSGNCILKFKEK